MKPIVAIALAAACLCVASAVVPTTAEDARPVIEAAPPANCVEVNPLSPPVCVEEWASTQQQPGKPY